MGRDRVARRLRAEDVAAYVEKGIRERRFPSRFPSEERFGHYRGLRFGTGS